MTVQHKFSCGTYDGVACNCGLVELELGRVWGLLSRAGISHGQSVDGLEQGLSRWLGLPERVTQVLRRVEFVGQKCPLCAGWNVDPFTGETPNAHTKDCALAALLEECTP